MKKQGWILVGITCAFVCVLLCVFLGRNSNKSNIHVHGVENVQQPSTTPQQSDSSVKIDVNTATVEQLQLLPGIGEALAQRIIDYREAHGQYTSIEELMNVSGIGEKKFANIKDYIKVG